MTSSESSTSRAQKSPPFGAIADGGGDAKEGGKRRRSRRGGRRRRKKKGPGQPGEDGPVDGEDGQAGAEDGESDEGDEESGERRGAEVEAAPRNATGAPGTGKRRRRGRRRDGPRDGEAGPESDAEAGPDPDPDAAERDADDEGELELEGARPGTRARRANQPLPREAEGMFVIDKGGISVLRLDEYQWLPSKWDIYVPKRLVQQHRLRDGMLVHGRVSRGFKHKLQLDDVTAIDGKDPKFWKNQPLFQNLTSIDPDFHYAIGDITDEVSMRVVDLLAPIGRGQRAILVAPPRTGKTTLLRQFAAGIEQGYPDVHLMVLLIDERPEEATEWQRSITRGKVYASTADETAKHHIELAEAVWKRACRMVEAGDDVVLLLDSITRLARAYNNQAGSGRTMSGGLDSRAMERPRKIFGSARNTVEAGSLTIIGTCLIDTGSRMDQMVFEEFKGTGNSEIVLSRRLSDRRIFPAIDVEKSGTRKEEKLVGMKRLKQIHTLRRVLARMHFAEAMDLLVTRLGEAEKTADFLERFSIDPEA